jgi:hypothetical protein
VKPRPQVPNRVAQTQVPRRVTKKVNRTTD